MGKLGTFLLEEIRWGRVSWMALAAAAVVILTSFSRTGILSLLPMLILSIGGILVESAAPRHPYLNSLIFGLLSIAFTIVLLVLYILGAEQRWITSEEILGSMIFLVTFVPQSLLGTWIGVTIRRVRETTQRKAQAGTEQRSSSTPSKASPPSVKAQGGRQDSTKRKRKGGKKKR